MTAPGKLCPQFIRQAFCDQQTLFTLKVHCLRAQGHRAGPQHRDKHQANASHARKDFGSLQRRWKCVG